MVAVLDYAVFALAFIGALYAIVATLQPAMPRIVSLLSGHGDPAWAAEPPLAVSPRYRATRMRPATLPARLALCEAA